jgi:hypothetical protein
VIFGVALPIIHINVRETRDQELQFLFIEDCNEFSRNNVMETYDLLVIVIANHIDATYPSRIHPIAL